MRQIYVRMRSSSAIEVLLAGERVDGAPVQCSPDFIPWTLDKTKTMSVAQLAQLDYCGESLSYDAKTALAVCQRMGWAVEPLKATSKLLSTERHQPRR